MRIDMTTACRIAVGLLLFAGGILKAKEFRTFIASIHAYAMFAKGITERVMSIIVMISELALGTAVMFGWLFPWSGVLALSMLALFTIVVVAALLRGKSRIKCGCMVFGRNERIGWHVCLRNFAFACLLLPSVLRISALLMLCLAITSMGVSVLSLTAEGARIHAAKATLRGGLREGTDPAGS